MPAKLKQPDFDLYRLMIQEVKDYAIFLLDIDGNILSWNAGAQRLKGYTANEIIGKHFSIFYEKQDIANEKPQRVLEMATTEGRVEDEGWRLRKDGTRFWADVVITALHDSDGHLRGFAKITRDMTLRRQAEEAMRDQGNQLEQRVSERTIELEKANRLKDEFITTLSHELRTPLTAITGWVQMLEGGELTAAQQRKAFEVIDRNLAAQTQLIDDLLNVSRIVTGKMKIDLQLIYPALLIHEAIESLLPTASAKNIKVTQDLAAGLGPIRIDPPRFHQIIWNLLTNAVKFTPKNGHVHVVLKRINSHALIQVVDSGEGIEPDFLPFAFERFRQADASRTRRYGGLGVGLAIAKSLVELHGGLIYAESAGAGKGSTFNVSLPIPALSSQADGSRQTTPGKTTLKGLRILVVEDEADTREMIAQALKSHGAKATTTESAQNAFQLLEQQPFDLIISDIGIPNLDGYGFIRKLRSMKEPICQLPAIALTAYAGEEDRKLSLEAGFNAHIPKPITLTELLRMVGKLIPGRGSKPVEAI